jgi:uncharacterized phage protein (TIGR02218 family)
MEKSEMVAMPELYVLRYGVTIDRYTSWPTDITFLGNLYKAGSIKRGSFDIDSELSNTKIDIAAALYPAFLRYVSNMPIMPTLVTIYRSITDDYSQYAIIFDGKVMYITVKNKQVTAHCETDSGLDIPWPRLIYESYCNHDLFDSGCQLDSALYRVIAVLSDINDSELTSTTFSTKPDGYFIGGWVDFGGDMRMITNHVGNIITIQIPFDSSLIIGSEVDAYPGCSGSPDHCKTKFLTDNYNNFFGMPMIPSTNPVMWGI